MAVQIILALLCSVGIGVWLGAKAGAKTAFTRFMLIASAGFLITVCLLEVFPAVYGTLDHSIGLFVLAGVLLQMLLENMTKGFEHGHFHPQEDRSVVPVSLMLGLFIHAFVEGIPLQGHHLTSPYLQGILIHNLPISIVLGAYLFGEKKNRTTSILIVLLFAAASPLGYLLGGYISERLVHIAMAVVGGIFLHISSVIIFESNKNHQTDWKKFGFVLSGIIMALLLHTLHDH